MKRLAFSAAIVIAAVSGGGAVADQLLVIPNQCLTTDVLAARASIAYPDFTYQEFDGLAAAAITDGMIQTGATINATDRRSFLVASRVDSGTVLIMAFRNGCYEGYRAVPRSMLESWLSGKTVSQGE